MNAPTGDTAIGRLIDGRYEVTRRIARGGMATVYHAVDRRLDQEVAVKVMHPHLAESDDFVARFRREARAAARLSHPNVVGVYDQGLWHDSFYLTMEYVEGEDLRARLRREGTLTLDESLAITENVLEALGAAHRRELVHRDIKPENVMIDTEGVVKVADFGLARAVSDASAATTGTLLGTVAYLAPELVTDGETSPAVDVYAAGILLYEMLTGVQPFTGDLPIEVALQHVNEEVPPLSEAVEWIPAEVDHLVDALTAREPSRRIQDGGTALGMLRTARAGIDERTLGRRATAPADPATASPSGNHTAPISRKVSSGTIALPMGEIQAEQDAKPKKPKRGRRSRARAVLLTLLILLTTMGAGVAWYYLEGPGAHTELPDVVGEPSEAAIATLDEAGFSPRVDQQFHDDVPVDTVIATDPEPLSQAKRGATVTVFVSLGVEMLTMPELLSLTAAEAAEAVRGEGFPEPTLTEDWSETVPEGGVISATIEGAPVVAGDVYDHRSVVEIVASKGREPVTIPNLVGLSRSEAEASLEEAGLNPQFGQAEYSETVDEGAVIRQSPPAHVDGSPDNIQLYRGDTVTLVLSLGLPYVEVPDLFGKTAAEAEQLVRDAGLVPNVDYLFGGVLDSVWFQTPQAGDIVRQGSTISYTVA